MSNSMGPKTPPASLMWEKAASSSVKENTARAEHFSNRILERFSPYSDNLSQVTIPSELSLIQNSSILLVRPDLANKSYAPAIAFDEYAHYVTQTYFFEVLGFQIVADLAIRSETLDQYHAFLSQAFDEVRHVQVYYELRNRLPFTSPIAKCIPTLFKKIIEIGTFPEKVLKGLVVLEGLAIGLFAARATLFQSGSTYQIDSAALKEETQHHGQAVSIVSESLKRGEITYDQTIDILREGMKELVLDILPTSVAEKHAISLDVKEINRMKEVGLAGRQASVSRSCFRRALKAFSVAGKTPYCGEP